MTAETNITSQSIVDKIKQKMEVLRAKEAALEEERKATGLDILSILGEYSMNLPPEAQTPIDFLERTDRDLHGITVYFDPSTGGLKERATIANRTYFANVGDEITLTLSYGQRIAEGLQERSDSVERDS